MREYLTVSQLSETACRAVIINCGTKWITTLALLSALRHARCNVVIINCESRDGSRQHFAQLAHAHSLEFDWVEWPLRPHPIALDQLFDEVRAKQVLLIDSDLEILSDRVIACLHEGLDADESAYGASFVHRATWMGKERGLHANAGYYVERMWIPLVLLRTATILEARRRGLSFKNHRIFTELPAYPRLARWLGYRYRVRGLRQVNLSLPQSKSRVIEMELAGVPCTPRPSFVEFDTGALLHHSLLASGHKLAPLPEQLWGDVRHYHGVTRAALSGPIRNALKRLRLATTDTEVTQYSVYQEVLHRLADEYGVKPKTIR